MMEYDLEQFDNELHGCGIIIENDHAKLVGFFNTHDIFCALSGLDCGIAHFIFPMIFSIRVGWAHPAGALFLDERNLAWFEFLRHLLLEVDDQQAIFEAGCLDFDMICQDELAFETTISDAAM